MDRRTLERLSMALGAAALAGTFIYYVDVWVNPRYASGELESWTRAIVDGTASAPYQYRVLVPAILIWLTDHAGMTVAQATILVDGLALALGTALGFRLLRQRDLLVFALPAAMYAGYLGVGLLFFAKSETLVSFAALSAALLVLEPGADGDRRWWVLAAGAVVLAGCRTDLLVALGVGFGVRSLQRRTWSDRLAAGGLVALAVGATVAMVARYPDAKYPAGVGTVQLQYNFRPLPLVTLATFLGPALGPLVLARAHAVRRGVLDIVHRNGPLLAVVATEVAFTLVVGEIDEVRLLFPMAFAIAIIGIESWRAVVGSVDPVDARST